MRYINIEDIDFIEPFTFNFMLFVKFDITEVFILAIDKCCNIVSTTDDGDRVLKISQVRLIAHHGP